MQRWTRMCAAAGVAALISSMAVGPAMAQPPGGGQGRQRGGFGGGRMGGFGGGQTTVFSVLQAESVQKELAITDDQKEKLRTLGDEVRTAMREAMPMGAFGRGEGGERPSPEAMAKTMAEMREKSEKLIAEKKPALAAILSAEQMTRVEEIVLQAKGADALAEAEIQAKLAMNDEQKAKIASITKDFADKQREQGGGFGGRRPGGEGGFDREAMQKAMEARQALTKEKEAALVAVLTPVQTEQFDMMKGKEFDVASLRGGFGGRGPGGPGGPGGDRPGRGERGGDRPARPETEN